MRALVNGSSVVFGPAAWDPAAFSRALGALGVSASLPGSEPATALDFGGGIEILPVSDDPPSFDPLTQQLVAGTPTVAGGVVTTTYTVANLPAATAATNVFAAKIEAGLVISSTGTPALSGTYTVDQQTQLNIDSELLAIGTNGVFTDGASTKAWPDASGVPHTFTIAQFKTFATAIGVYVDALIVARRTMAAGGTPTWPTASTTIP